MKFLLHCGEDSDRMESGVAKSGIERILSLFCSSVLHPRRNVEQGTVSDLRPHASARHANLQIGGLGAQDVPLEQSGVSIQKLGRLRVHQSNFPSCCKPFSSLEHVYHLNRFNSFKCKAGYYLMNSFLRKDFFNRSINHPALLKDPIWLILARFSFWWSFPTIKLTSLDVDTIKRWWCP